MKLSGMSKQEYIMHRLQNREMTIQANLRVVKALRQEFRQRQTGDDIFAEIEFAE